MSNASRAYRNALYRDDVADVLTPLSYDDDSKTFALSDDHVGFGFISMPMIGANEAAAEKLNVLFSFPYPAGTIMSISLIASQDINWFLDQASNLRSQALISGQSDDLLQTAINRRVEFLRNATQAPLSPRMRSLVRDFYVVVSVKVPAQRNSRGELTSNMASLIQELRSSVGQSLETLGMPSVPMTASLYIRTVSSLLNWEEDASWRIPGNNYDGEKLISEQLVDFSTIMDFDDSGLWLGKKRVKVLSPKKYPDYATLAGMLYLIGDPRSGARGIDGNFVLTMNVSFPDNAAAREALDKKKMMINYQSFGPVAQFSTKIKQQKEGIDILYEALDAGDKVLRVQHTAILFCNSEEHAVEASSNMISYYREHGYHMQVDAPIQFPLFMNALPLNADTNPKAIEFFKRYMTFGSGHAAEVAPIVADWKGTGTPTMSFISRSGQIMSFDLFDSNTNFNAAICAASGSGKSFLTNDMITAYRSIGSRVWVIDVGRSYLKLCQAMGGTFIEFSKDSNICLNPFQLVNDYEEEGDMLIGIIIAMASPTEKVSDFQYARVRNIVKECWDIHGRALNIDIIAEALKADDDLRVKDMGYQLYAFTSTGEYGRWFYGENNVSFDNPFCVLELEELKARPHLQQIVLLLLIYLIQQEMYLGDRNVRKLLFVDEAWDLLTKGDVAKFIEGGYRRFRKYNAAAIVITQSLMDLYGNPSGVAIADNSANLMLLGQKPEAINTLKELNKLSIGDGGFELLKTVHTLRGVYSEIFFYTNGGAGIGRLAVDRYAQLLYSTHPDDVNPVMRRVEQGMSMSEAIDAQIAEEQARKGSKS